MESKFEPQDFRKKYRERVDGLWYDTITPWPGLESLRNYLKDGYSCTFSPNALKSIIEDGAPCLLPSDVSIINITSPSSDKISKFSIMDLNNLDDPDDLFNHLPSLEDNSDGSKLVIIENICPKTLTLIGGYYDIDPQFFAQYTNILSWYQMFEAVPERLSSLPSTKKAEDFLMLRYVSTRQVDEKPEASIRARSVIWPDMGNTRLGHSAGRLKPISAPEQTFPPMAFTRQCFSVWCKKKTTGNGWIAIMLLDKPFQLREKYGTLGATEYRNPNLRPSADEDFSGLVSGQSFKKAFCAFFTQRCAKDDAYLKTCFTNPFLTLYEGYRIIASEWLVVNEYVKRELANIERHLEKQGSTFRELEGHLKELYRIRRRCNKDHELVLEAFSQCEKRGQPLWPHAKEKREGRVVKQHTKDLEEDFNYVLGEIGTTISRIEKDINHLMALVAISEGRQTWQENRGISFLTLVATIFLPSTTVGTILGMQTQFAPGERNFWMLWAVAIPLTIMILLLTILYPIVSAKVETIRGRYYGVKKAKRKFGVEFGLLDERSDLPKQPKIEVRQVESGSVV